MSRRPNRTDPGIRLIESWIPLIQGEVGHTWDPATLWCPICGEHKGFVCSYCNRVVDYEIDTPLFEAITSLLKAEGTDD